MLFKKITHLSYCLENLANIPEMLELTIEPLTTEDMTK
jgi:hypothetical protein